MRKRELIREAWACRGIHPLAGYNAITHFLYLLKYIVCVLLGWHRKDAQQCALIWLTKQYPVYTAYLDPPEPAWDEHYVGTGFRNWYYTEEIGIR